MTILATLLYTFFLLDAGKGLPENNVRDVLMLPDGHMCIRTGSALNLYDGYSVKTYPFNPVKVQYSEYSGSDRTTYDEGSGLILCSSKDDYWAFSPETGSFDYDVTMEPFSGLSDGLPPSLQVDISRSSRCEVLLCRDGSKWVMTDKALLHYDPATRRFDSDLVPKLSPTDLFTSIALDSDERLWIGTARSGVSILDRENHSCTTLPWLDCTDGRRIYPHSDISKIYADRMGGIWIATLNEGLAYWHPSMFRFSNINNSSLGTGTMADEGVKCLLEDKDGAILVGTIRGLLRYDPENGKISVPFRELSRELCISLYRSKDGSLWLGTFYNGMFRISPSGSIRHFNYPIDGSVDLSYQTATPNRNCVRRFFEDSSGNFWVSVYGGLGKLDVLSGRIEMLRDIHPELEQYMIVRDIRESAPGRIDGCGDNGSFSYDCNSDAVLSSPSSQWGRARRNVFSESIEGVSDAPNGLVLSLLECVNGEVWASTEKNIFRVKDGVPTVFSSEDGIDCGTFFQNSALLHSSGKIYFGGSRGICVADPSSLIPSFRGAPSVVSVISAGEPRIVGADGSIRLEHNDFPLEISFTAFDYSGANHALYRYSLAGSDGIPVVTSSHSVSYPVLLPGDYVFAVATSFNGTEWSDDASIHISVLPSFWKSKAAYSIYAVLLILLILSGWLALKRSTEKKYEKEKEDAERRQKEELDQMKTRFFYNISHELRTPLSLIMLPAESLGKESDDPRISTIKSHARELLDLVNHLLDFRRLEIGGEKLSLTRGDFGEFVGEALSRMKDAAISRGITLEYDNALSNPTMSFDAPKMGRIVRNLVSNAIKYTPEGGYVSVRVFNPSPDRAAVTVSDTGVGMSAEDVEHIFERFFRSEGAEQTTGSGIGLNIVKQYVELMNGEVDVKSEPGKGSVFTVTIPVRQDAPETPVASAPDQETSALAADGKTILLVDDNDEFRSYLASEFSSAGFGVIQAADGRDALEKASKKQVDIAVCDVMMPVMDGIEFTRRLKGGLETSHIPVVLLTARTSEETRLEGYETGADAYLTKPFRMEMLLARINNLLEERRRRIASFASKPEYSPSEVAVTTLDQKLMARILDSIERNMDNEAYSVEILASDVCMHRMNLYRKLQSLSGMTPSEFIRSIRLKRAAQLLGSDPSLNISEVASMVGFGSAKIFTQHFKEMFGVVPSQYNPEH